MEPLVSPTVSSSPHATTLFVETWDQHLRSIWPKAREHLLNILRFRQFYTNSTYMAHFWVTTDPVLLDYFLALNSTPTRKVLVNKTHGLRCLAEPFTHLLHPIPTEQFTSLK